MDASAAEQKWRWPLILSVYYLTLTLFLWAGLSPEGRVWGVSWWAFFPVWVPLLLFCLGVILPLVLKVMVPEEEPGGQPRHEGRPWVYILTAVGVVIAGGLAFYLLRTTTHFFGDGYQNLAALADKPLIKSRELGESLIHVWVKTLFGGEPKDAAVLSYRFISIGSGIVFLILAGLSTRLLFARLVDRVLFLAGIATAGYMLLFFGYVENYSMFVMSVAVFSLAGLLITVGKLSRWWIVPIAALAVFLHILGATLIPAAAYLLIANSRAAAFLSTRSFSVKGLVTLAGMVVLAAVFYYY